MHSLGIIFHIHTHSFILSLSLSHCGRAIHRSGTECLRLLLKPDMTYFKDHRGRTVIHLAAKEGAMAASEIIIKMRPDAIFDTDKLVCRSALNNLCMQRSPMH